MVTKVKQTKTVREAVHKRTSQGGRCVKTSTMDKCKKRDYKKYRGQG